MTTTCISKSILLFLIFNILLSVATHAQAARSNPTKNTDKKKPDCIVDPDGSVLFPGLGRILVPIPGTVQYDPPAAGSSGLSGGDGSTFPSPDVGSFPSPYGGSFPSPDGGRK